MHTGLNLSRQRTNEKAVKILKRSFEDSDLIQFDFLKKIEP